MFQQTDEQVEQQLYTYRRLAGPVEWAETVKGAIAAATGAAAGVTAWGVGRR
jgi:hypothetical protein